MPEGIQTIRRFGVDQTGYTHKTSHYTQVPMEEGWAILVTSGDGLKKATGQNIYGVVQSCQKISDRQYKVTVCTRGERVPVRIKEGEDLLPEDGIVFDQGLAKKSMDSGNVTFFAQDIMDFTLDDQIIVKTTLIKI